MTDLVPRRPDAGPSPSGAEHVPPEAVEVVPTEAAHQQVHAPDWHGPGGAYFKVVDTQGPRTPGDEADFHAAGDQAGRRRSRWGRAGIAAAAVLTTLGGAWAAINGGSHAEEKPAETPAAVAGPAEGHDALTEAPEAPVTTAAPATTETTLLAAEVQGTSVPPASEATQPTAPMEAEVQSGYPIIDRLGQEHRAEDLVWSDDPTVMGRQVEHIVGLAISANPEGFDTLRYGVTTDEQSQNVLQEIRNFTESQAGDSSVVVEQDNSREATYTKDENGVYHANMPTVYRTPGGQVFEYNFSFAIEPVGDEHYGIGQLGYELPPADAPA